MEHMQQQLEQQRQQIAQMAAHLQQQPALQQPMAAAAVAAPRMNIKLPAPSSYEGKASTLLEWEASLRRQFTLYQYNGPLEVSTAAAFLTGAAHDWWVHLDQGTRANVVDFTSLVAALKARFMPVTSADTARAQIARLEQGKSTVNAYISAFRQLLPHVPTMGHDDRLFAFKRGLKPIIATQLTVHGVKTLDAAIEMAARVGAATEHGAAAAAAVGRSPDSSTAMEVDALGLNAIEGLEQATETDGSAGSGSGPVTLTREALQMLLAAARFRSGGKPSGKQGGGSRFEDGRFRFGNLSREQMDSHFAAGTCFLCGKAGHRAKQCPKNPKRDQSSN
jgi:hypothetical protein